MKNLNELASTLQFYKFEIPEFPTFPKGKVSEKQWKEYDELVGNIIKLRSEAHNNIVCGSVLKFKDNSLYLVGSYGDEGYCEEDICEIAYLFDFSKDTI